jgi:hypothetical protein
MTESSLKAYLKNVVKAQEVVVGAFVRMDNTTFVSFIVNGIDYELKLPKHETYPYYHDYFSRNYPELLL